MPEIHFTNETTVEEGRVNISLIWKLIGIMTSFLHMLHNFIFRMTVYEIDHWEAEVPLSQFGKLPTSKF